LNVGRTKQDAMGGLESGSHLDGRVAATKPDLSCTTFTCGQS